MYTDDSYAIGYRVDLLMPKTITCRCKVLGG
jgi:hypothetical protein